MPTFALCDAPLRRAQLRGSRTVPDPRSEAREIRGFDPSGMSSLKDELPTPSDTGRPTWMSGPGILSCGDSYCVDRPQSKGELQEAASTSTIPVSVKKTLLRIIRLLGIYT